MKTKNVVVTFGRFQPPTLGHEHLAKVMFKLATEQKADCYIVVSASEGIENPLDLRTRIKFLKRFFPFLTVMGADESLAGIFQVIKHFGERGYDNVSVVVGSDQTDRLPRLRQYIDHEDPSKRLKIKTLEVVSAGIRNPDSDGVEGISGTKMRHAVRVDDYPTFRKGLPRVAKEADAKALYTALRKRYT